MSASTPTHGMVLGKFMPPHAGHCYLFDFAKEYVDKLTIVVETEEDQPVPGEMRFQWVQEMYPNVNVVHLTDSNPQDPSEHPDFWNIWKESLIRILPQSPDFVFASEPYGHKLSKTLGARFVPVDIERSIIPVSGTAVRNDPLQYWEYLPRCTRPFFAKRICIFGAESTGKSTLATNLARHFNTVAVPEYARTHLELQNGDISLEDIPKIAKGQLASEDALAKNANRLLFCDSDLLLTTIWSDWLFQSCPDWIRKVAQQRHYDLYLVPDFNTPWVDDIIRYLPQERQAFFKRCLDVLDKHHKNYLIINGTWEERFAKAVSAVNELLKDSNLRTGLK